MWSANIQPAFLYCGAGIKKPPILLYHKFLILSRRRRLREIMRSMGLDSVAPHNDHFNHTSTVLAILTISVLFIILTTTIYIIYRHLILRGPIRNVPNERSEWDISYVLMSRRDIGTFPLLSLAYVPMSLLCPSCPKGTSIMSQCP